MITTIIIISAYIISVFISRLFDKLIHQLDRNEPVTPLLWFIVLGIIYYPLYYISKLINNKIKSKSNWFTGKNW